ncbi:MAG TPA: TaqI-like C-terminal specificity domain-containing protein [Pyrinomonadaceae bacterium]|jgi:hypothetical protein
MATGDAAAGDRARIEASIKAFGAGSLARNAVNFFDALGYRSERAEDLEPNTAEGLLALVNRPDFFNRRKARPEEWASIDLLFQLTDEEVRGYGQAPLDFDSKRLDMGSDRRFESYLFFAVQLKGRTYNRTALADITREINRFFDMPALVLFRHGATLTLSVINRRLHKRDAGRDVLEKVTLVKDIRVENPHRAHVEILFDLALPQLVAGHRVANFVELHDAWRKTLDVSELNRRFYKDLANWYFWALGKVRFPPQPGVADEVNRATNVIRLITRLTFVWFLKERQLVPDDLFRRESLEAALTDLSPESSTFYKAILQNLFFAALNTPMNDPANPREFREDAEGGGRFDDRRMARNQYLHRKLFRDPAAAPGMFASVPFLNGGLFECLDKWETVGGKLVETRVDGFSDLESRQPSVPNLLFFCEERDCAADGVDLNAVYGTRNKTYKARGLIDTLNRYKFTVAENTPIDEEVALDPELLGKVFENLLASYNPETGATARKQTGSFYTPREIVNYMVDESLIAYLETRLAPAGGGGRPESDATREEGARAPSVNAGAAAPGAGPGGESLNSRLRRLFAYTDEPHGFADGEVEKLIRAIDEVKILDPACGSGAYPMGILGKLVFILSKLDPQNARWKQRQIDRVREAVRAAEKIEDAKFRESTLRDLQAQVGGIEEAFRNNELDYGRKLFLIENCIYGVDIQPIAIQISKLRFFISLVIDQRVRAQAENLGIRPLPNLETKFVAANTLLGVERLAQGMLHNEELRRAIEEKERELKIVRERHFTARTTRAKEECREEDERLRREIGELLKEDNWSAEATARLTRWDPYDQNASADFFDPEWMFGARDGFDIVVSNPPYYLVKDAKEKAYLKSRFKTLHFKINLFACFIEHGVSLTRENGVLTYINPNLLFANDSFKFLREFLCRNTSISFLLNLGDDVFENVTMPTMVFLARRQVNVKNVFKIYPEVVNEDLSGEYILSSQERVLSNHNFVFETINPLYKSLVDKLYDEAVELESVLEINQGIITGNDDRYLSADKLDDNWKPTLRGRDVEAYKITYPDLYVFYSRRELACPRNEGLFDVDEKLVMRRTGDYPVAAYDDRRSYNLHTLYSCRKKSTLPLKFLLATLNSKVLRFLYQQKLGTEAGRIFAEIKILYVRKLPIKKAAPRQQAEITQLVDQILDAHRRDPTSDTGKLTREIDRLIYQLYGLTPDEIEIVERSTNA